MPPYDIRERTFEFACAIVRFHTYLLQETRTPAERIDPLLGEAGEIISIITSIRKNARHRSS